MALNVQGVGKGKIIVKAGPSVQGLEAPIGCSWGSVVNIWWACEVVAVGDNILFFMKDQPQVTDGTYFYYVIDESDYLYTEIG